MKFSILKMIIYLSATIFYFYEQTSPHNEPEASLSCLCLLIYRLCRKWVKRGSYCIFKLNLYILLLIRWAQRNCSWEFPMIWVTLTSTTLSNPSPAFTQDHLSKIVKNTSVIPFAINCSAPLPNKQKDVSLKLCSGQFETMLQTAR